MDVVIYSWEAQELEAAGEAQLTEGDLLPIFAAWSRPPLLSTLYEPDPAALDLHISRSSPAFA